MALKDQIYDDLDIFFDNDEFAEYHTIEGKEVLIIPDNDKLIARKAGADMSISESTFLFFVRTEDMPKKRGDGDNLNFDSRICTIDSWTENIGVAEIVITQPRMR